MDWFGIAPGELNDETGSLVFHDPVGSQSQSDQSDRTELVKDLVLFLPGFPFL